MLIGDVSVLYGGNAEKGHGVGRRQKGLPLPCRALQELHLGNTAKPSPDAGTTTLLGGTKVQSEATMPPAGATPSQSPQQDLPWGRGWANSSTGTYMRTPYSPIDALPLTPPGKQLCRPSFFSIPVILSHLPVYLIAKKYYNHYLACFYLLVNYLFFII